MPFRNSPDNMQALQILGQTLVNGRQNEAQMRLRVALAQQAAARQARHDALQAGVWEAQAGRAKTQAALDAAKQAQIDQAEADINEFGLIAGSELPTGDPSMQFMDIAARIAARGKAPNAPKNIAQMRALGDPRLAAMLATGSQIRPVPAGATMPDAATGDPAWTAPFTPEHQFGALGNILSALATSEKATQLVPGVTPDKTKAPEMYDKYNTISGVQANVINRLSEILKNGANTAPRAPIMYPRRAPGPATPPMTFPLPSRPEGAGTVLAPQGAAVTPSTGDPYDTLSKLHPEVVQALLQALSNGGTSATDVPTAPLPAPPPAVSTGPGGPWTQRSGGSNIPGPVNEFIVDEKTGQIVPVTRPLER